MMEKLGKSSGENGKNNVSFLAYFLLGDLAKCLQILIDTDRIPEAAFFARFVIFFHISEVSQYIMTIVVIILLIALFFT